MYKVPDELTAAIILAGSARTDDERSNARREVGTLLRQGKPISDRARVALATFFEGGFKPRRGRVRTLRDIVVRLKFRADVHALVEQHRMTVDNAIDDAKPNGVSYATARGWYYGR